MFGDVILWSKNNILAVLKNSPIEDKPVLRYLRADISTAVHWFIETVAIQFVFVGVFVYQ